MRPVGILIEAVCWASVASVSNHGVLEMRLRLVTREAQLEAAGVLPVSSPGLSDHLFDGLDVPLGIKPRNWLLEYEVHETVMLSTHVDSTRNLFSPQVNILRDEVRDKTWCAVIEGGRLSIFEVTQGTVKSRVLAEHAAWRSHIVLNKFTGEPLPAWITSAADDEALWFAGRKVPTEARRPDFPFVALSQAPIGHVQSEPPPFGLITYKCREGGRLFARRLSEGRVEGEVAIDAPEIVGGFSIAISGDQVLSVVDAVEDGRVTPMSCLSTDGGKTFGSFEPIEVPLDGSFRVVPASGPPVVDYGGFFHVPLTLTDGEHDLALNIAVDEAVVEAIRVPTSGSDAPQAVIEVFPRKPEAAAGPEARFGTGVTDGYGLIMVMLSAGRLFTSNSQAGGLHFPEKAHLNHEMPTIAAFAATECYTSGRQPNTVSMDYMYLESDVALGGPQQPLSRELHFETWDMPLPVPQVTATAQGSDVTVHIEHDANFMPGETSFDIDDSAVAITSVEIQGDRDAVVGTDSEELGGKVITFEVRSRFYHHLGTTTIAER